MMKKIFLDVETTGTDIRKHSIHQISALIEVDGEVVEEVNLFSRPHHKALYEPAALRICGKTEAELKAYPLMDQSHRKFVAVLGKYVDKFVASDKFHVAGFNNRAFDDPFMRVWFEQNGDDFFGSWFFPDTLDVMTLASEYLLDRRAAMPSFKLKRVAREVGIYVDESKLHDASYDVVLTRGVYRIVTGREIEI
jgi:DNA polymerase-3 subunit epsilon